MVLDEYGRKRQVHLQAPLRNLSSLYLRRASIAEKVRPQQSWVEKIQAAVQFRKSPPTQGSKTYIHVLQVK